MTGAPLPMAPTPWFGRVMEVFNGPAYRRALKGLPRDGAVLEIGFGSGRLVELLLARKTYSLVAGVDPTPAMVRMAAARPKVRRAGDRVDLRLGDAERLPWADARFDVVLAVHSFQFWSDPAAGLREIRRVAAPGGLLRLLLRDHDARPPAWLPNPISRSGREIDGAVSLLRAQGFVDVETDGRLIDARSGRKETPRRRSA